MKENNKSKLIFVAVLTVLAILSHFVAARYLSSPNTYANTIASLEEKQTNVLELTAATTATSAAITLLPGDTATPIAEKMSDLSFGFLVVLCAIFLEKYLLTIIGYLSFGWLIPAALVLLIVDAFADMEALKKLGSRVLVFAVLISLVIPTSVRVADLIDDTYQASINSTIEDAKDTTDEIKKEAQSNSSEGKGFFSKITGGITEAASSVAKKVVDTVNKFLEAMAIMLVTSCLIPILVLLIFVWLINMTFSTNLTFGYPSILSRKKKCLDSSLDPCE